VVDNDKKINILYVDDEENNLFSFKATFRLKYNVFTAISGNDAIAILREHPEIEIIITDQKMPNMTGVEFLETIIPEFPDPMRILLTGYADLTATIDAVNKGKIFHYLNKPWKEEELDATIQSAYEKYIENITTKKRAERTEVAEQLANQMEFMLRQKLIS
jgi:response regulator RpfG family c-di-GMP phosphodiesterase